MEFSPEPVMKLPDCVLRLPYTFKGVLCPSDVERPV